MSKNTIAHIFNEEGELIEKMTPRQFQSKYHGQKPQDLNLTAQDENGVPLSFLPLQTRIAGKPKIREPFWKRPPGQGDGPREHLFARNDNPAPKGHKAMIQNGGKILITINTQLSDRQLNFTHMLGQGAVKENQWRKENHGNYISASVHSAQDIVDILKNVKKWGGTLRTQIDVRYHDAVLPYSSFYMGDKRTQHSQLYDDLQNHEGGVPIGSSIMVGFPRLMAYIPTDVLLQNPYNKDGSMSGMLMGNTFKRAVGKPLISQLVFPNEDDAIRSDAFNILHQSITEPRAQYILASPSVRLSDDDHEYKFLRWEVHNIDKQTAPINDEGHKRLIQQIEENDYSSSRFKGQVKYRLQETQKNLDLDLG